jgi:hypothetical protein
MNYPAFLPTFKYPEAVPNLARFYPSEQKLNRRLMQGMSD